MPNNVKCRVVFDRVPAWAPILYPRQVDPEPKHTFDRWVPRPPNLLSQYQSTFRDLAEALGEKSAAHLDEIEWMRREWGTAGDGYDFKGRHRTTGYCLEFTAAWSAPLPVFLAMAQKEGPLRASWYEEYGQHAGHVLFKYKEAHLVATEVVKIERVTPHCKPPALFVQGLPFRRIIGSRFIAGSFDDYLIQLRASFWGVDSAVPLVEGETCEVVT